MANAIQTHYPALAVEPCPITGSLHNSSSKSALGHFLPFHDEIEEASYAEYQAVMKRERERREGNKGE